MTTTTEAMIILAILGSVFALTASQILLKRAMKLWTEQPVPWGKFVPRFGAGVALLSAWFYLWLTLLQVVDLSWLYPFEALSGVFVALASAVFLKEKMSIRLWVGIALIVAGVTLVSIS